MNVSPSSVTGTRPLRVIGLRAQNVTVLPSYAISLRSEIAILRVYFAKYSTTCSGPAKGLRMSMFHACRDARRSMSCPAALGGHALSSRSRVSSLCSSLPRNTGLQTFSEMRKRRR